MKKIKKIPTILGLVLVLVTLIGGIFLIGNRSKFFTKAQPEIIPKEVKITNITDVSFSVSWITDQEIEGFVQYGEKENELEVALDDRDQISGGRGKFSTHHVTVKNLKPLTLYLFKIGSGGEIFDNNGNFYQVRTGPKIEGALPPNDIAYGEVLLPSGLPAEGVIVYFSLVNAGQLSVLTRSSGTWAIPLNLARKEDLSSWAQYDKEASLIEIFVQGGNKGKATTITTTKNDSPVPSITLGKNFDFRSQSENFFSSPTPTFPSSRLFGEEVSSSQTLKIINPEEGEKISTSTPEFFGVGPAGEKITIKVESPETLTGEVFIDEKGNWRWTPPKGLSPGEHKITIYLADGTTVTRSFTVLAAESNLPSFTSSPSATITVTPSFTPTPTFTLTPTPTLEATPLASFTPTPIQRTSLPSTEGGVPTSGILTPTLVLLIMGIGLILISFIFKNFLFF